MWETSKLTNMDQQCRNLNKGKNNKGKDLDQITNTSKDLIVKIKPHDVKRKQNYNMDQHCWNMNIEEDKISHCNK